MTASLNSGRAFLDAGPGGAGSTTLDQTLPFGSSAPGSLLPQVISSGPLASGLTFTSVPGPPPMPGSSSPKTIMMPPGNSGSFATGPAGTTMMMPGTVLANSGVFPPPSVPTMSRSFTTQSQPIGTIQPGTLPPGSLTQLPVSGALPASRIFPSEAVLPVAQASQVFTSEPRLPVAQAMPFSASSIGTSRTLGTSLSMRPPPTMPPDAYRDLPQSSMRMEPMTQPVSRSYGSNPYGDGLLADSEPEVEQGNFTDFMMHHAKQDDIEHNLEDDFGELAFIGNLAPQGGAGGTYDGSDPSQEKSLPYGMTQDAHQDYQTQLEVYKKAEKAPHEKVEHHHVDHCHQQVELAKAGRLEKDLLHAREDQLERRLAMLERIAGAAPSRPRDNNPYSEEELQRDPYLRQQISPFMDKFLPVPLGGGLNWHYFNHHQGFYIDRNKIAQREAQLKHMEEQHQHPFIFALAGKKLEEIPESYWSRDYKSWMQEDQLAQMSMQTPNPYGYGSMGGMGGGMNSMGMGGGMPMGSMGGMGGPPTMGGMPPTMGGPLMGGPPTMGGMPMGGMPMGGMPMGGMPMGGMPMGGMPMGGMPMGSMGGMPPNMGGMAMGQSMRAF